MKRSLKEILGTRQRMLALIVFSVVLAAAAHGQLVVSAGPNGYVAPSGLMGGAGLEVEGWLSISGETASQGLMLGGGLQYVALTTSITHTPGSGWLLPVSVKYGFPVGKRLVLGLGGGVALVLADADQQDYFGGYYTSTSVGGAPFASASLYYFLSEQLNLQAVALAGADFSDSGTFPFFGLRVMVGLYIRTPHPAREELDDSEDY